MRRSSWPSTRLLDRRRRRLLLAPFLPHYRTPFLSFQPSLRLSLQRQLALGHAGERNEANRFRSLPTLWRQSPLLRVHPQLTVSTAMRFSTRDSRMDDLRRPCALRKRAYADCVFPIKHDMSSTRFWRTASPRFM
jgi:hypothetical protein